MTNEITLRVTRVRMKTIYLWRQFQKNVKLNSFFFKSTFKMPFRLEPPDKHVVRKSQKKLLYTQNEYQPGVKISNWQESAESIPIDNDPYCPGSLNYFLSHYNRLGTNSDESYLTTTQCMLEQIYTKAELDRANCNLNKHMMNYITYNDTLSCDVDLTNKICPEICAESYLTTMQWSYPPPYPYRMQRFSFPTIPFLQNRKLKWDNPVISDYKFYDEGYKHQVSQIQKIKGFRTKSYDALLGQNSDGSLLPERKQKCFQLEYL